MMFKFLILALLIFLSPSVALADMNAANQALKNGDYVRAAEEFRKVAEQGNPKAQSHLGYMYYAGEGVPQSFEEAVKWYGKAAVQGDRDAQYNYAVAFAFGEGTKQDYKEAAIWYRRAAEQGHPIAQYSLGISYTYGEGVPQDEKLAAEWFIKSAEAGYENAQVMVGSLYHTGDGLPKDYAKAVEWYRKAADRGNAVAQYNLGAIYRAGKGVPKNTDEALKWYRLAAAQNYEAAQNELASLERTLAGTRHEKVSSPPVAPVKQTESVTVKDPTTQLPAEKKVETPAVSEKPAERAEYRDEKAIVAESELTPATDPEKSGGLLGNLKKLFKSDKPEEVAQSVTTTPEKTEPVKVAVTPEPLPEPEPVPTVDEVQVEKTAPVIKTVEEPEVIAAIPETSQESIPEPQIKTPETPAPTLVKEPRKPVFTPGTTATSISEIARPRIEAPDSIQIRTESTAISTALIDRPKKEIIPEEPVSKPAEPVTEVVVSPAIIAEVNEPVPEPEPVPAEAVTEVVVTQPVISEVVEPEVVIEESASSAPEITTGVSSDTKEKTGGLAGFFGRMFSSEKDEPVESVIAQEEIEIEKTLVQQEQLSDRVEDEPTSAISYAENAAPANEQLEVETDEQPGRLKSFFGRLFSSEEKEITTVLTTPEPASKETVMDTSGQTSIPASAVPEPELKSEPESEPVPEMDWNKQLAESDQESTTIIKEEVATAEELRGMEELQIAKLETPEPVVPVETKAEKQLEKLPDDSIDALTARAVAGNADAQFELAQSYHQGNKVARDPAQAFLWYRRAALQGNMEAQFILGNLYLMGEGTTQSDIEARNWFEKASRQGHEAARNNLENLKHVVAEKPANNQIEQPTTTEKENKKGGVFDLVTGLFDSDDEEIAEAPAQVAAAKPVEPATTKPVINKVPGQSDYERGLAYSYGDGVPQNYGNAFKLFESAAKLGHASAQYQLAMAYANGHGVTRNPAAAVEWYEKAARQGLAIAQRSLGNAYLSGNGVPANKALAFAWYSILADQGNVLDVHRRDTIKKQLTDAEILESESLKKQLSASLSTASTTSF